MAEISSVKDVIAKVEQGIENLARQLSETRKAVEQLASSLTERMDKTVSRAESLVVQIRRELDTFGEQRRLVESMLTTEVERAKKLSKLKDLEDAVQAVIEAVEEMRSKVDLNKVLQAVQELEARQGGSLGPRG